VERINDDESRISLLTEHHHRYQIAEQQSFGDVLDISCGVGYGSKLILRNPKVTSYLGIDVSPDAISQAKKIIFYDSGSIHFATDVICAIDSPDQSFNTIVT